MRRREVPEPEVDDGRWIRSARGRMQMGPLRDRFPELGRGFAAGWLDDVDVCAALVLDWLDGRNADTITDVSDLVSLLAAQYGDGAASNVTVLPPRRDGW